MLPRGLMKLHICSFHMPSGQVVRHTLCRGVSGLPFLLATAAANVGSCYFPVYNLHDEYRDYNQNQYICAVRIPKLDGTLVRAEIYAEGIGFTVEMAVQDAARHCLTMLRDMYPDYEDNSFRYCPGSGDTLEGCFTHTFADSSQEEDPRLRCTADLVAAYAHRERELFALANTLAANLRNLTDSMRPFVDSGLLHCSDIENPPIGMSPMVASPDVGGVVPPRGRPQRPRMLHGSHQPPHISQDEVVLHFRGALALLPHFFGGY